MLHFFAIEMQNAESKRCSIQFNPVQPAQFDSIQGLKAQQILMLMLPFPPVLAACNRFKRVIIWQGEEEVVRRKVWKTPRNSGALEEEMGTETQSTSAQVVFHKGVYAMLCNVMQCDVMKCIQVMCQYSSGEEEEEAKKTGGMLCLMAM